MKAKSEEEKEKIRLRFAVTIWKQLTNSRFESARKYALESGMEPAHVQKLIREPKDVTLVTIVSIADGFGISIHRLGEIYDSLTDDDYTSYYEYIEEQKKKSNK